MVTLNVQTLSAGSIKAQVRGLTADGKALALAEQFNKLGIAVVALQECRTHTGTRHNRWYYVYCSGSDGNHGCELWFHKSLVIGKTATQSLRFRDADIQTLSYDHRHLLMAVHCGPFRCQFMSVHAPLPSSTDVQQDQWWAWFDRLLTVTAQVSKLILGGDLNARLGQVESDSVSNVCPEPENAGGRLLHPVLLKHNLFAANTFPAVHQGPSATWRHHTVGGGRLDYFVLHQTWKSFEPHTFLQFDLDTFAQQDDHQALQLSLHFVLVDQTTKRSRPVRLRPQALQEPEARSRFVAALDALPPIPWAMGVGCHAEFLTQQLQQLSVTHFKSSHKHPRQPYMSPHTWSLVQCRKRLARYTLLCESLFRRLQSMTHKFESLSPDHDLRSLHQQVLLSLQTNHTWSLAMRRSLHRPVLQQVRTDKARHAYEIAKRFESAGLQSDAKKLFQALQPLLGQTGRKANHQFRPLPGVKDPAGHLITNLHAIHERWESHFAALEEGRPVSPVQLQAFFAGQKGLHMLSTPNFSACVLPTLQEVEHSLRQFRSNKAPGPDGLIAELYQVDIPTTARLLFPLVLKVALRCREAMRFKGGQLIYMPKKATVAHDPRGYRGIMLQDVLTKLVHKIWRSKLQRYLPNSAPPLQAGCLPGTGPDQIQLLVQSHAEYAASKGLSHACVFIDINSAYYRLFRPALLRDIQTDEDLAAFFRHHGLSSQSYQTFMHLMHQPDAFATAQVPDHLRWIISDVLNATWFSMADRPTVVHTTRGSRPGSPLADMLFAFLLAEIQSHAKARLVELGVFRQLPLQWLPGPEEFLEPPNLFAPGMASWADDLTAFTCAETPDLLLDNVRLLLGTLVDAAASHCTVFNFAQDKTEVVLRFRGSKARQAWDDLTPHGSPELSFSCESLPQGIVHVRPDYVHLGSLYDGRGHPHAEVKRRFQLCRPMSRLLLMNIFRKRSLQQHTREMLYRSLINSKLLYGSATWQQMNVATLQFWVTQLLKLYRRIVPTLTLAAGVHQLDIVTTSMQLPPLWLLSQTRLRLFVRVFDLPKADLLCMLQAQTERSGWLRLIRADLNALNQLLPTDSLIPEVDTKPWSSLAADLTATPRTLLAKCKLANACFFQQARIWNALVAFRSRFVQTAQNKGALFTAATPVSTDLPIFHCPICQQSFASLQRLFAHDFKQHRSRNVASLYAVDSTCRWCLRQYHSRVQLLHHLKYTRTGCLHALICTVPPLDPESEESLAAADRVQLREQYSRMRTRSFRKPVRRLAGPVPQHPWLLADLRFQQANESGALLDADLTLCATDREPALCTFVSGFVRLCTADSEEATLYEYLQPVTFAQPVFFALWDAFDRIDWDDSVVACDVVLPRVAAALELWRQYYDHPAIDIQQHMLSRFRVPACNVPQGIFHADRRSYKAWLISQHFDVPTQVGQSTLRDALTSVAWLPAPCAPLQEQPVVLYLYSGRRRPGDFAEHFIAWGLLHGVTCHPLLIDVALSADHDMRQEAHVRKFESWIGSGKVLGILMAPPCESWSSARALEGNPRVLRLPEQPWVRPNLTLAELEQILVANELLFTAIHLALHAVLAGVSVICEHPRAPKRHDLPSIWKTPVMRWLRLHPAVTLENVYQGQFEGVAWKPTTFLVAHLPRARETFRAYAKKVDPTTLKSLVGKDDQGAFHTSSAKEYSPYLNQVLAKIFMDQWLSKRKSQPCQMTDPDLLAYVTALRQQEDTVQEMQPDYAPIRQGESDPF